MRGLRSILFNILLIGVSLVVGLLMIEVGVRALNLYRFPADNFIQPHPELGWSHIPNKEGYWTIGKKIIPVKINSKGLRDIEYTYEKREGIFRILVLGDSFTEAFQVPLEDTFCEVLEYELNTKESRFEVINAGFSGVGTDYALLFYKREGYKYHPDLVVLAFFANDIYDNYRSKSLLDDNRDRIEYERKGFIISLKKFLAGNSCAYNYFGTLLPKELPVLSKALMKLGLISYQPVDEKYEAGPLQYQVLGEEYGSEMEKAWDVTRILIEELRKETEKYGSNLVVFSIPFREQIDEDLWRAKLSQPGMARRKWDLNRPDRILSEFLNDAEIPFLSLVPHLKRAAEYSKLYHPLDEHGRDGHWNAQGHHLAAQIIHNWLAEENLVPIEED